MSIDHRSKRRDRWVACAGAVAATALAASAVHAQVTQPNGPGTLTFPHVIVIHTPPTAADTTPAAAAPSAGMRAYIDPATGRLTNNPTPEQVQELEAAAASNRTLAKPGGAQLQTQTFRGPGRATRATLDDSYLMYSVARRAGDGELETACVVGDAKMRDFIADTEGLPPVRLQPAAARPVK